MPGTMWSLMQGGGGVKGRKANYNFVSSGFDPLNQRYGNNQQMQYKAERPAAGYGGNRPRSLDQPKLRKSDNLWTVLQPIQAGDQQNRRANNLDPNRPPTLLNYRQNSYRGGGGRSYQGNSYTTQGENYTTNRRNQRNTNKRLDSATVVGKSDHLWTILKDPDAGYTSNTRSSHQRQRRRSFDEGNFYRPPRSPSPPQQRYRRRQSPSSSQGMGRSNYYRRQTRQRSPDQRGMKREEKKGYMPGYTGARRTSSATSGIDENGHRVHRHVESMARRQRPASPSPEWRREPSPEERRYYRRPSPSPPSSPYQGRNRSDFQPAMKYEPKEFAVMPGYTGARRTSSAISALDANGQRIHRQLPPEARRKGKAGRTTDDKRQKRTRSEGRRRSNGEDNDIESRDRLQYSPRRRRYDNRDVEILETPYQVRRFGYR